MAASGKQDQLFVVREKDGLSFAGGPPRKVDAVISFNKVPCSSATFSDDGSMLALVTATNIRIVDGAAGAKEILSLPLAGVVAVAFSPQGTYFQTFQKMTGPDTKNLNVWKLPSGEPVYQQLQKQFLKEQWPSLQFSDDETVAWRTVTNEVQFYDGKNLSKGVVSRLKLEKVAAAQVSPCPPTFVAAYVPEIKGAPASVRIFNLAQVAEATPTPIARRSFYKSSTVRFAWNKGSTGVLVLAQSDVDKSNKSYYGETALHFLSSDGQIEGTVPLTKEGPIHDFQWAPSGEEFVVVHGFMPAKASLFNSRCKQLFVFPEAPRNAVRWDPFGQFLMLGGFGNLPGDMEFWDRKELKLIGSTKAPCTVSHEWSPDGRFLMTATTMPRLQVDNGIRIFKYTGDLVYEQKYSALFQADWRPAKPGLYKPLPVSPRAAKSASATSTSSTTSEPNRPGSASSSAVGAQKPGTYRSPHAVAAAAVRAQLLGLDDEGVKESKPRRRRPKAKASEDGASGSAAQDDPSSQPPQAETATTAAKDQESQPKDSGGDNPSSKIRAVQKKLRQIEDLKKKASEGGGIGSLQLNQQEKLKQEPALLQELANLQLEA